MKPLDILAGEGPLRREAASARLLAEHVLDAAIACALHIEQTHRPIEPLPEPGQRPQSRWRCFPASAADVRGREVCVVEQLLQCWRLPVNELGAELDGTRCMRIGEGKDAPAYARARFEDFDVNASLVQRARSGQSSRSRANHNDHATKCTSNDSDDGAEARGRLLERLRA